MKKNSDKISAMLLAFCISFAIPNAVLGDNEDSKVALHRLEPVVVTATRTPTKLSYITRSVSVIDASDIKNSPAYSVEELLRYALGVDIMQRGPYGVQADSGIRGSTFSQVLILVNGIRVNDPQTAHHNFDLGLTLQDIERIEILRGHGSSLYGADAFGGIINIITKKPDKVKYADISYGEYNTSLINGGFSEKRGSFGTSFSLEKKKSDGYRYDTDFDITTLSSNSTLNLPDLGSLNFLVGYTDKEFGANDFYGAYPSKEWTDTVFMSMGSELKNGILKPNIFYRKHRDKYMLDISKPDWYVNHHTTNVYGAELQSCIPLGVLGNLILGGEGVKEEIESSVLGDHNAFRAAVYAENESLFADKFILNLGIRGDHHSIYGMEWAPSVSAGWRFSSFMLRSSVGRTFRAPSFTELYYKSPANLGNPNLKPENAWSYELGADYYHSEDRLRFGITSFRRNEVNLIDWIKKDVSFPQWKAENITKAQIAGIETTLKITPINSLDTLINYTFTESHAMENKNYISKYALNYPRHQFGIKVGYRFPFGVQVVTESSYKERAKEKGYVLLDARISKRFSRLEIYIEETNILGTEYQDIKGVPMPGRWFKGGLKVIL
mgnify:FL=1